jgi:flagellar FliJ protein
MPFKFSLATVLRVRGIIEEREERMLQRIQFEIMQTREMIVRNEAAIAGSDEARRANLFKPVSGCQLRLSYEEMKALKQHREELEATLAKLEELRARQLAVYEAARRNREMITDMREEKREAYNSEMARREQKTLDDNFISRRGRT